MSQESQAKPLALIVEDDDQTAYLMQFILEQDGLAVRRAATLAAAMQAIGEISPPALVTLDITLPDGSGVDLIVAIKEKPGWEKVPIMMVTGRDKDKGVNWAIKSGSRAYIVKPFKPEELRAKVARLIAPKS